MPGAGVLLDLDGTLVDSNYLHTLAWKRALADCGEWAPSNAIHRLVGMGGDQLVPTLLGREVPGAAERRAEHYARLLPEVVAFPGAGELLSTLRAWGLAVVLASSAPGSELDPAVGLLGGRERFDAVTGADDVTRSKPDPEVFRVATQQAGLDRDGVVTVGDSVWDVEASRAAGYACIGVETGGFSRHELTEAGAVAVYRDVAELVAQARTSPVAALR